MGAGKSTVARRLAEQIGAALVFDSDEEILRVTAESSIAEIFADRGAAAFRELERSVILDRAAIRVALGYDVWSLGGGAVLDQDVVNTFAGATVIYLELPVDEAWTRVNSGDLDARPLVSSKEAFAQLFEQRSNLYSTLAEVSIDATQTVDAVVQNIAEVFRLELAKSTTVVANGLRSVLADTLPGGASIAVVFDQAVSESATDFIASTQGRSTSIDSVIGLPMGEWNKQLATVESILNTWSHDGLRGDTTVVAIGGGTLLDTVGFAASIYHRGLRWVSVPTTVTAQVDAGIGGKTGVNLGVRKNIVGSFALPWRVAIDPEFLHTLPAQVVRDGLIEAIKTGFLDGLSTVEKVEHALAKSIASEEWVSMITACVCYKNSVVHLDPHDTTGIRAVLNLGHTAAHALEAASVGRVSHGAAVACGLRLVLLVSVEVRGLSQTVVQRYLDICDTVGIQTQTDIAWVELAPFLASDKKRTADGVGWVLLDEIGHAVSGINLDSDAVGRVWDTEIYNSQLIASGDIQPSRSVLVLFGVNLGELGRRDTSHYGSQTLADLVHQVADHGTTIGWTVEARQTDSLERFVDSLHAAASGEWDAVIVNPGAWTHYERAIHDAIEPITVPVVEVHLSDIENREDWRAESVISPVVDHQISGKGSAGYFEALTWISNQLTEKGAESAVIE